MRFAPLALASLLAVDPWGWDRFGPFRFALVLITGVALVARAATSVEYRGLKVPKLAAAGWGVLLVAMAIATAASVDRWHSLVGTPDRRFGLLTWLLCGGMFVAGYLFSKTQGDNGWRDLMVVLSGGFGLVGLYVLAEMGGVGGFASGFAGDRAGGPFGQPAYLGAACALGVPIGLSVVLDRQFSLEAKAVGLVGTIGAGFALLSSQSRAAWVGLAISTGIVAVRARRGPDDRTQKAILGAMAVLVLAVLAIGPLRERATSLTDVSNGVVAGRIDEWQVGTTTLFSSPKVALIGLGPESYRTEFGAQVDQQYVIDHGREVFTDRAHNGVLDVALASGLIGAVGFAVLLLAIGTSTLRALDGANGLRFGLAVGVIAYFVQQFALFSLAELDPLVFALAGLLVAGDTSAAPVSLRVPGGVSAGACALLGGVFVVAIVGAAADVVADHKIEAAFKSPARSVALADEARGLRVESIRYDFVASRFGASIDEPLENRLNRLADGLWVSPRDPALLTEQARLSLDLARQTGRADDLDVALSRLEHLGEVDPNHPANQQRLGIAYALRGDYDSAVEVLRHAVVLAPDDIEPLINLATAQQESPNAAEWPNACITAAQAGEIDPGNPRVTALLAATGEKSC